MDSKSESFVRCVVVATNEALQQKESRLFQSMPSPPRLPKWRAGLVCFARQTGVSSQCGVSSSCVSARLWFNSVASAH